MGQRCSNCSSSGSSAQDEEMLRLLETAIVAGQSIACKDVDVWDLREAVDLILEGEKAARLAGERNPTRYARITSQRAELLRRLEQRIEELEKALTA